MLDLKNKIGHKTKQFTFFFVLIISEIIVSIWLYNTYKQKEEQAELSVFNSQSQELTNSIQKEISLNLQLLVSINSLYSVAYPISREHFKIFCDPLLQANKCIQAIEWIPLITEKERSNFERMTRERGFSEFQIMEKADGKLIPAGKRQEYFPIYYIEPLAGNEAVFGFDLASNEIRRKTMEMANLKNQIIATSRITLVQEKSKGKGVLAVKPFIHEGKLIGYFAAVFKIQDLISRAIGNLGSVNFNIYAYDLSAKEGEQFLGRISKEDKTQLNDSQLVVVPKSFYFQRNIKMADRDWLIQITPSQKYLELRSKTYWLIIMACVLVSIILGYQFRRFFKADDLLYNMLPIAIANELKDKGSSKAHLVEKVTVIFTDFVNFTQLSSKLTPKELVTEINEYFSAFDLIMVKHGVEKIKTIGDAYMAVGGLPIENSTHAIDVVNAAMEIQQFVQERKVEKEAAGRFYFEIRIGINTGPVIAGVVGIKKFAYDIWGDTVNTASRIESSSEVGKINISDSTYELVKSKFNCVPRGMLEAKGKGKISMFFVEGRIG